MTTVHLQFEDYDPIALQRLCGALDDNLTALAHILDTQISRRFDHFTFSGSHAHAARNALVNLMDIAEQRDLSDEDINLAAVEAKTADSQHIEKTDKNHAYYFHTKRGSIGGRTPRQNGYIRALLNHDIVFGLGPAGTGKTYLAVAAAVDAMDKHQIERIVLVRPAVEAGEKLGFLPGDLAQKVDPYLRPLYDALYDLMGFDRVTKLMEKGLIEIAPLAYMRGRTLNGAYVILDEAQNTTPEQMKMFLTRIGFGTKAVITGDLSQIDLPRNIKSGLRDAREKLGNVEGLYFHTFTSEDVVRHPLVQKIVEAYDEADNENKNMDSEQ
ncbi:PhoH family protein [Wielerella bovis]|uniref:PhoH family protein n=1 Tax=Wielerella bovis TaxID=2917790 RepID=UPI0020185DB9|nr:PhoH family protein [Wielerella bovis]MCG7656185.1 PhoH family protein [Wielerella bovis]MCG7658410.1 PhoH family protein [Wielerella bovis]ULJ62685.1 PhoH family protein [Wielerella bovis]